MFSVCVFCSIAEFIYHRDTHESPSLKSYFDERDGQSETGVRRSISEPINGTKSRPKLKTSPLASSSSSAVSRESGLSGAVGVLIHPFVHWSYI